MIAKLFLHNKSMHMLHSPLMLYGLDLKAEGRADSTDVLALNLLHNSCLSGIVQATAWKKTPGCN